MANTYITIPDAKEVKQEFAQIYKEHGLEGIATETGVVEANNLIDVKMITPTITQLPQVQTQIVQPRQGVRVITVPSLTSAQTPAKLQTAQQFVSPAASPIIVSTPCSGYRGAQVITQLDSPVWSGGKKRTNTFPDLEYSDSTKKRRMDKTGKGLRHFSMKVCEKVQKKGVTSYNEVADELVADFTDPHHSANGDQYDQKNIRRRVYDALNVLMAMNIISKEKKEIRWKGLPTNSVQECQKLEKERTEQIKRVEQKTQQLQELILQQIAFKNLVERNKSEEQIHGAPADSSAIQLPFIIVNTSKKTVIDCSISNDKYEYMFNFDNTFEIHDDIEVLKRMGMAFDLEKKQCTPANLQKALQMMPKSLEPYIKELGGQGTTDPLARCGTGSNNGSTSSSSTVKYGHLALSPLATPLSGQSTKKQSLLDLSHEQELAAAQHFLSRQSSIGSYSRDSQLDDIYSEGESDSERSSPVEILT